MQLTATGGCNAAQDNSGTEFVFTDPSGRKIAVRHMDNHFCSGVIWQPKLLQPKLLQLLQQLLSLILCSML